MLYHQQKYIKAYTMVENEFADDYLFHKDEWHFFDNQESAREDIEDFVEQELIYMVEVSIRNNLFNIYNTKHRSLLYNSLSSKINVGKVNFKKDSLICLMMGVINRDEDTLETIESTSDFFSLPVKNLIKSLGFNGFISMHENLSKYTVFNPDNHIEIKRITL